MIRLATASDLDAINAIYNHYVLNSTCTYQTHPSTAQERAAWFEVHGEKHPVTVFEKDGEVVGWGSLSRFHPRAAYGRTVENSVYVRHDMLHMGIGRAMLADLIERARGLGHHTIVALISADQTASVELHRKFGFAEVAHLKEVGYKFGRWLDVTYMQLMLNSGDRKTARIETFKERLANGEMQLGDGAWGTQLQRLGLEFGACPEEWNVSRPDEVRSIAREYLEAGADFCLTNTFGANRYRLTRHGFASWLNQFNTAGVRLSREAAVPFDAVVAASVGPTGEFVQPEGMLSRGEMLSAFAEQIAVLKDAGADAICIETMYVPEEAALAVEAAKKAGMFCMACITFDATPNGFRTMLGATIQDSVSALENAGADVIGSNCGNGMEQMVQVAKEMRPLTKKPLMIKANAGIPELVKGKTVYNEGPGAMAKWLAELKSVNVSIVGGCCGTTPEHIRRFRAEIDTFKINAVTIDKENL